MPAQTIRMGTALRIANRAIEFNATPRPAGATPCRPSSDSLYTGQNPSSARVSRTPAINAAPSAAAATVGPLPVRLVVDRRAARSATHLVAEVPEDVSRNVDAGSDSLLRQFPHASLLPGTTPKF